MTAGPVTPQRNLKSRRKRHIVPYVIFPPSKFCIDFVKFSLDRKLWQGKRCTQMHMYLTGTSMPGFFSTFLWFFSHFLSLPLCCVTFSRFQCWWVFLALVSSNWECAWWDKSLPNWHRWLNCSWAGRETALTQHNQGTHSYYKISWAVILGTSFLLHEISTGFANDWENWQLAILHLIHLKLKIQCENIPWH